MPNEATPTTKKTNYRWLVVAASHLTHMITYGAPWSVGLWNAYFLDAFGRSAASTAFIGSILNFTILIFGFIAGNVFERFGARVLMVTGGSIAFAGYVASAFAPSVVFLYFSFALSAGVGLGLCSLTAVIIVAKHCADGRATVEFGLATSGIGTGMFVFPMLNEFLVARIGWRRAIASNGVISLFIALLAAAVFREPHKEDNSGTGDEVDGEEDEALAALTHAEKEKEAKSEFCKTTEQEQSKHTYLTWAFLGLLANNFLYLFGQQIVLVHLVKHLINEGVFGDGNAGVAISAIGLFNMLGRMGLGALCLLERFNKSEPLYMLCMFTSAACAFIYPFTSKPLVILFLSAILGFASGALGPLLPDIIENIVSRQRLGIGYGIVYIFEGLGCVLGPPAAGLLKDIYLTYEYSFYLGGAAMLASGVCVVFPLRHIMAKDAEAKKAEKYLAVEEDLKNPPPA